jgi:hypothetical protein
MCSMVTCDLTAIIVILGYVKPAHFLLSTPLRVSMSIFPVILKQRRLKVITF